MCGWVVGVCVYARTHARTLHDLTTSATTTKQPTDAPGGFVELVVAADSKCLHAKWRHGPRKKIKVGRPVVQSMLLNQTLRGVIGDVPKGTANKMLHHSCASTSGGE